MRDAQVECWVEDDDHVRLAERPAGKIFQQALGRIGWKTYTHRSMLVQDLQSDREYSFVWHELKPVLRNKRSISDFLRVRGGSNAQASAPSEPTPLFRQPFSCKSGRGELTVHLVVTKTGHRGTFVFGYYCTRASPAQAKVKALRPSKSADQLRGSRPQRPPPHPLLGSSINPLRPRARSLSVLDGSLCVVKKSPPASLYQPGRSRSATVVENTSTRKNFAPQKATRRRSKSASALPTPSATSALRSIDTGDTFFSASRERLASFKYKGKKGSNSNESVLRQSSDRISDLAPKLSPLAGGPAPVSSLEFMMIPATGFSNGSVSCDAFEKAKRLRWASVLGENDQESRIQDQSSPEPIPEAASTKLRSPVPSGLPCVIEESPSRRSFSSTASIEMLRTTYSGDDRQLGASISAIPTRCTETPTRCTETAATSIEDVTSLLSHPALFSRMPATTLEDRDAMEADTSQAVSELQDSFQHNTTPSPLEAKTQMSLKHVSSTYNENEDSSDPWPAADTTVDKPQSGSSHYLDAGSPEIPLSPTSGSQEGASSNEIGAEQASNSSDLAIFTAGSVSAGPFLRDEVEMLRNRMSEIAEMEAQDRILEEEERNLKRRLALLALEEHHAIARDRLAKRKASIADLQKKLASRSPISSRMGSPTSSLQGHHTPLLFNDAISPLPSPSSDYVSSNLPSSTWRARAPAAQ